VKFGSEQGRWHGGLAWDRLFFTQRRQARKENTRAPQPA
jgi:hypothetical protein